MNVNNPRLTFEVTSIDWRAFESQGEYTFWNRLAAGDAALADFPLLGPAALGKPGRDLPVTGSRFLDREAVAGEIARQNPALPAPPAGARYIVAGQQPGLLTGPLYTILKAVSAIGAARRLADATGETILPLFWIAGEDHDLDEVNRLTVNGLRFVHAPPVERTRGRKPQVADIPLREAREPLLAFLRSALPATEFTGWVLEAAAGLDFANFVTAFRQMMDRLFADFGLRQIDPIPLRPLTAPVLAELVERWDGLEHAFTSGSDKLRALGIRPPLERLGLYRVDETRRVPIEVDAAGFRLDSVLLRPAELAARIRSDPSRFSAGAALRPLCQDGALPVLATVCGPTELAYLRQIDPLYAAAGLRPSLRLPRISATFLEPGIARTAEKAGLAREQLFADFADPGFGAAADGDPLGQRITEQTRALLESIERAYPVDPPRWLRTGREGIEAGVARILSGLHRERLEQAGLTRARLEKIAGALRPDGRPQERVVNVAQFLNLHGPEFITRALATLHPFSMHHQLVKIVLMNGDAS
ncbi:MAG: bacillithiol biosynthesis cysteine-adding enzyme BshC [Candidatus Eisenbacteria bacterium]